MSDIMSDSGRNSPPPRRGQPRPVRISGILSAPAPGPAKSDPIFAAKNPLKAPILRLCARPIAASPARDPTHRHGTDASVPPVAGLQPLWRKGTVLTVPLTRLRILTAPLAPLGEVPGPLAASPLRGERVVAVATG